MKYEIAVFVMCVLLTLGNCASGPHIIDFMSGRFGSVETWTRAGFGPGAGLAFNLTEEIWELAVNVNMAAWWVIPVVHIIVAFLSFPGIFVIKVSGDISKHQCVSGSQVLHVNFDQGPIPECCVMNTTPTSYKQTPTCDARKEKEQAKNTQGKPANKERVSFCG